MYFLPLRHCDGAFVGALERQCTLIRRPPVALEPVHFLLRDEVSETIADRRAGVIGHTLLAPGLKIEQIQIAEANVGQVAAPGRELETNMPLIGGGEPA